MNLQAKRFTCIICLAAMLSLSACGSSGDTSTDISGYDLTYSDRDLDSSYDKSTAVKISLADDNIKVKGYGAEANGSTVKITEEGCYIISGESSDGQIIVDTPDDQKVQLVLDGITLTSSQSAPLYIKESDKVFITLAEGSANFLTGPDTFSEEASEANIDGTIFSKGDLCINGNGTLDITAASGHGIVSKDDLIITGGDISVKAAKDGLQGKDCVKIKDGNIDIDVDNDGIRSSNEEDEYRGFISVDGGNLTIDAGYDGLQAETLLRVAGGTFDIITGGGSKNASTNDSWGSSWGGNKPGGMREQESSSNDSDDSDTISAKGLKVGLELQVLGGTFDIDSSDDALHSNGDIIVEAGEISVSSGDDGAHADSDLNVAGGTINIVKSYESIEGNTITIDGGQMNLTASDDGLNAAGGSDSSGMDRPGAGQFEADESAYININGGDITIYASGDGIDSNGSLSITGGNTTVTCPTTGDTAVLDYGSDGSITGGTFIGTGAVQMAMTFSYSEQGVVAANVGSQSAGSKIILKDSDGNTVISHTPSEDFAVAIISIPKIVSGDTYTISVGSTSGEIAAN